MQPFYLRMNVGRKPEVKPATTECWTGSGPKIRGHHKPDRKPSLEHLSAALAVGTLRNTLDSTKAAFTPNQNIHE